MKKNNPPVIHVNKTGTTNAYFISGDDFLPGGLATKNIKKSVISKASGQEDDQNYLYDIIPQTVSPNVSLNFYKQLPYHMRAIKYKAACVALLGGDFKPVDPEYKDYQKDTEYLKGMAIIKRPNMERERWNNIMFNWLCDYYIFGHGFLEDVDSKGGELAELYNLRAFNIWAKLYYNQLYYIQRTSKKDVWFCPYFHENKNKYNGIIVFKNYNPESKYYGCPEYYPAVADLVLDRSITEYRIRKFDNNLMMQFVIICEGGTLNEDSQIAIKKYLSSNFKGVVNAGKVLYLNTDNPDVKIHIEKIEAENKEVDFIKSKDQIRDTLLIADGVPPALMGVKTPGQLGATTELKDLFNQFNETIIKPDKQTAADIINDVFETKLGITKFKWEFKELTIDKLTELVDMVDKMVGRAVIDENEGREVLGWSPKINETPATIDEKITAVAKELRLIKKQVENS